MMPVEMPNSLTVLFHSHHFRSLGKFLNSAVNYLLRFFLNIVEHLAGEGPNTVFPLAGRDEIWMQKYV